MPGNHALPTNFENCDGLLYCIADWASDVTLGMFWAIILLAFSVIIFIGSQRFGSARAFGFASFSGMIGSIFLATLQLIPWWIASIFILMGLVGFGVMILNEK